MPDGVHIAGASGDANHEPDDCSLQFHIDCDGSDCEVHRILKQLTEGQVRVTITAAITAIIVSTVYALGAFGLYCYLTVQGKTMAPVPWWITALICMPYGGAFVIKLAPKIPFQIGGPKQNDS